MSSMELTFRQKCAQNEYPRPPQPGELSGSPAAKLPALSPPIRAHSQICGIVLKTHQRCLSVWPSCHILAPSAPQVRCQLMRASRREMCRSDAALQHGTDDAARASPRAGAEAGNAVYGRCMASAACMSITPLATTVRRRAMSLAMRRASRPLANVYTRIDASTSSRRDDARSSSTRT